jgi:hypothetical protein
MSLVLVALSIPVLGGISFAAAQSVSNRPAPQVVIPAATVSSDRGARGADDPSNHDAGDDRNGASRSSSTVDMQGTTSMTFDDKGGLRSTSGSSRQSSSVSAASIDDRSGRGGADDPATHDLFDDRGGAARSADDSRSPTSPTSTTIDDHGGASGKSSSADSSGSSSSGSSSSGGSDDSSGRTRGKN